MRFAPAAFSPHRSSHVDGPWRSLAELCSLSAEGAKETGMLRSRIDEQSSLIGMLKQRADDVLLRSQALQALNAELEGRVEAHQKELDGERKKGELLKKRFMDLAANNQAIIAFMNDHKEQNSQLKTVNKQLQLENETLFSQKLHDKELLVQKLKQEIKQLTEKQTNKENEYREKLSGWQSKLLEKTTQHQSRDASLLHQLQDAQEKERDAVEMCNDLEMKLQNAEGEQALKDINLRESITRLTKERDKLLHLSMERGEVIQEKQKEIQQLEKRWKEEKKARSKAEDRFEQEAEAVNADVRVKSIQSALDESASKYRKLEEDFQAFKDHSTSLLLQERELNKKLRHMMD
ncbi:coiled-coil domain-containing protein 89 isoform X2 [Gasterosteus aculeatus]|uniref:Zgc:172182 n=1 Tax=Gasterosteus aculeatus aculeatus TaxID=481459 RepID=G3NNK0_GASAC